MSYSFVAGEKYIDSYFDEFLLPTLVEYVKIPCVSRAYEPKWQELPHIENAVKLACDWIQIHGFADAKLEVARLQNKSPVIFYEIPGQTVGNTLMYGHLDKQPEMTGWRADLGPFKPVIENGRLYGRGSADDGYALFSSILAIKALREQGLKHPRIFMIMEFSEESGSVDLPAYIDAFQQQIGKPDTVICLDSCVGNYDQMWITTSLRGIAGGLLKVEVLNEGVHSGEASGIVPSSFRIVRQLLSRIEDENTGEILPKALQVLVPQIRLEQIKQAAKVLDGPLQKRFPFVEGMTPACSSTEELILNNTWKAKLAVLGADGLPPATKAGNVLRPQTTLNLSLRLPPTLDCHKANAFLQQELTRNPPYGSKITATFDRGDEGWESPPLSDEFSKKIQGASQSVFNKPAIFSGIGASIPFMGMLGRKFPNANFLITGVLGPESNAHGPNEFLHLGYVKKLINAVASLLVAG